MDNSVNNTHETERNAAVIENTENSAAPIGISIASFAYIEEPSDNIYLAAGHNGAAVGHTAPIFAYIEAADETDMVYHGNILTAMRNNAYFAPNPANPANPSNPSSSNHTKNPSIDEVFDYPKPIDYKEAEAIAKNAMRLAAKPDLSHNIARDANGRPLTISKWAKVFAHMPQTEQNTIQMTDAAAGHKPTIFAYISEPAESAATKMQVDHEGREDDDGDGSESNSQNSDGPLTMNSAVGMVFHNGVLVATDVIMEPNTKKSDYDGATCIYTLNDHISCAGLGDIEMVDMAVNSVQCRLQLWQFNMGFRHVSPATARAMLHDILLDEDDSMACFIVIGIDEGLPYLASVHVCGATEELPYCTLGYNEKRLMPYLEDGWRPHLTEQEAIKLTVETFRYGLRPAVACKFRISIRTVRTSGKVRTISKLLQVEADINPIEEGYEQPEAGSSGGTKRTLAADAPESPKKKRKSAGPDSKPKH
ncbi:hypothetical protein KR093_003253 [Drosophila rubida]|uniref:Uncharacterized protein n=1 Tax=Drosophila rubida TaxID=30044 RepID=A0AAD4PRF0_9MUSC|nr:hypothetical protein KR093_003253 [Drosophila rubida]